MTAAAHVLCIDLGTSGPKVALVTSEGQLVAWEFEATPLLLLAGGGAEQEPEVWWSAIKRAVQRLLARALVPRESLVAVSCTAQWSGTVVIDRAGKALGNAIIWMDCRGARHVRAVTRGALEVQGYGLLKLLTWIRITGGAPTHSGKDPIAHILFLKHECPAIYQAAHKFLEPKDYINLRLTGLARASYESIALHWLTDNRDLSRVRYAPRLLELSGIDREKLPELGQAVDILGNIVPEVAEELGLPATLKVLTGTPDLHSAAIGSGAVRDYAAHLYVGTSTWIACHVPFKKTDLLHNMAALPSAIPRRYLLTNAQECAGAALNFAKDTLVFAEDALSKNPAPPDAYALLDAAALRAQAGSGNVIFTPWLYGERAPIDDPRARGGFFNVSLRSTRAELVRAVYEGVAYNARWLLTYVEKFVGRRLSALNAVGGGAKSEVWCQIYADILDRPLHQVADPYLAGVRGAAYLAGVALGHLSFDDIPERVPIARSFEPTPAHRATYERLFRSFVKLYANNRALHNDLNRHV